jgi:hypothetical protein
MSLKIAMTLAGALLFSPAADAAVYTFNSTDLGISAVITTSNSPDGASGGYDIVGITGSVTGFGNIDGLLDNPNRPGTSLADFGIAGFLVAYDNLFFTADPHVDAFGVVFQLDSGNLAVLGCVGSGTCAATSGTDANNYELLVGNFLADRTGAAVVTTVASVPETSTWAMMILGLFGLGFMFRRQQSRLSYYIA